MILRRVFFIYPCILFFLITVPFIRGEDQRVIVLASAEEILLDTDHKENLDTLGEAFARIGISLRHVYYPEARCKFLADMGEIDGLPSRIRDFNLEHSNLLRVDVPLDIKEFTAYTTIEDLHLHGWDSLAGSDLRIIYLNGFIAIRKRLAGYLPPHLIRAVEKRTSALAMLNAGRADIFIDVKSSTESAIARNPGEYGAIREAGVMERDSHYLFLHKKHGDLIPDLERSLREMREEGYFQ